MNTKRKKPFTIFLQYYKSTVITIVLCVSGAFIMLILSGSSLSTALTFLLFATSLTEFLFIGFPYAIDRYQLMKLKDIPITQAELQEHNIITPSEWWGYVLYDMYNREKLTDMISSYINDCFHNAFPHNYMEYENLYMIRDMFCYKNQFITYLNNTFVDMQEATQMH